MTKGKGQPPKGGLHPWDHRRNYSYLRLARPRGEFKEHANLMPYGWLGGWLALVESSVAADGLRLEYLVVSSGIGRVLRGVTNQKIPL